jgi:hypothetical protein
VSISREGGCFCGAVRFRVEGDASMLAMCHCSMCRRVSGAPAVAWAMFSQEQVTITGTPAHHASSPGVERGHCAQCGTTLSFTADFLPGLIDLTVASFDAPESLPPAFEYWTANRISWMPQNMRLPHHEGLPPMAEG